MKALDKQAAQVNKDKARKKYEADKRKKEIEQRMRRQEAKARKAAEAAAAAKVAAAAPAPASGEPDVVELGSDGSFDMSTSASKPAALASAPAPGGEAAARKKPSAVIDAETGKVESGESPAGGDEEESKSKGQGTCAVPPCPRSSVWLQRCGALQPTVSHGVATHSRSHVSWRA